MATSTRPSRDKVRAHRERLRRQGLRPIQIWVPDVRSPAFEAEAHRQSLAVAQSEHESEDQAFIDAISDRVRLTSLQKTYFRSLLALDG
jgi:Antitoxin MazE-like